MTVLVFEIWFGMNRFRFLAGLLRGRRRKGIQALRNAGILGIQGRGHGEEFFGTPTGGFAAHGWADVKVQSVIQLRGTSYEWE